LDLAGEGQHVRRKPGGDQDADIEATCGGMSGGPLRPR
jgi:hypothetical protein